LKRIADIVDSSKGKNAGIELQLCCATHACSESSRILKHAMNGIRVWVCHWLKWISLFLIVILGQSEESDQEDVAYNNAVDQSMPQLIIHSPKNGQVMPIQLHGWETLIIDINVTVLNFDAREGSLALFVGNGELLLSEHWQPLNGNRVITYELPFPDKDDHRERLDFLTKGHQIVYRLEFSLLDAGAGFQRFH
jgi:hypothetical protein